MNNKSHEPFFVMENKIQNYAWGSVDSIYNLFDVSNPKKLPQAEVWMGAHPNGCSQVRWNGKVISLRELINSDKEEFLSTKVAKKYGELPYLFKILAAERALSIQVHPSKEDAKLGFEQESLDGIDLKSPIRNYKDPNHKPELVYALTSYEAMNGFRSIKEIANYFCELNIPELESLVQSFNRQLDGKGLEDFFINLLSLDDAIKQTAINKLLIYAQTQLDEPVFALIISLSNTYPDDIGLFAPLFLNYIVLKPGEAMYLDAQTPHAYLKGTGLEVMANSDNVLRAGLTPKHIDIQELAKCTLFKEKSVKTMLLHPEKEGEGDFYPVPVDDFSFAIYAAPDDVKVLSETAEIIMPIDTDAELESDGISVVLKKGQSVFIPAYTRSYHIRSLGRVARVYNS